MRFITLKLALLALLSAGALRSQMQDPILDKWRWSHFSTHSGLPSNTIKDVVETPDRIWAITRAGIAWFDEYEWHSMGVEQGLPTGLINNLTSTGDGTVMVRINNKIYRGSEHGFSHLPIVVDGTAIPVDNFEPVTPDHIFLVSDETLYEWREGVTRQFWSKVGQTALKSTRTGLWLLNWDAIYRWELDHWELEDLKFDEYAGIKWIVESQAGERLGLFFHLTRSALYSWQKQTTSAPTQVIDELFITADLGPRGEAIAVDAFHQTWLRQGGVWSKIPHAPDQFSLTRFLKFRDNGDLWLGTDKGLFLCRRYSDRWARLPVNLDDSPVSVHEIMRDRDGALWVATQQGLHVQLREGSPLLLPELEENLPMAITALCEDRTGQVWVGSGAGDFKGTYRYDGKSWKHIVGPPGTETPAIHKIRRDRNGELWFLALNQGYFDPASSDSPPGVYRLVDDYLVPWEPSRLLSSGRVYEFNEGPDGAYWIGTMHSLSRWHNDRWTHWPTENSRGVRAIVIDSRNHVWFGDFKSGLGYIDGDKIKFLTVADGLSNNSVMGLAIDDNDTVWMTTWGNGLVSYREGRWTDHSEGLSNLHTWPVLVEGDEILIGTAVGVDRLKQRPQVQPGNRVTFYPHSIKNQGINAHWRIFPLWGYIQPESVETRHRLDEGVWSPWSTQRQSSFFSVDYGPHQLQVQAKDHAGNFTDSTATQFFSIPKPYFLRAVFLIPVIMLFVGAIWLLLVIRRRNRLHRRERQEASRAIGESELRFRTLAQIAPVGIFCHSAEGPCSYVNNQYCVISGISEGDAMGYGWVNAIHPDDRERTRGEWALSVENRTPFNSEVRFLHPDGKIVATVVMAQAETNDQDTILGYVGTVHDITDRIHSEDTLRRSLHEKETLLREIHHRVKNNLQIISSLLNFQAQKVSDPAVQTAFSEVRQRLRSMILVHEKLYQGDHVHQVDFADYTRSLTQALSLDQVARTGNLAIQVESDSLFLPIEIALPCGMILAELLTNVQKYAFPNGEDGIVLVATTSNDDHVTVEVSDNGVGLPADFSIEEAASFGWRLIRGLTEQVDGTIALGSGPGTRVILEFSLPDYSTDSSQSKDR